MSEQRKANQLRDHVISSARRHADAGQLTLGQQLIEETIVGDHAQMLRQDIATRRASVESAVEKSTAALKADDWEAAIDHLSHLERACRAEPSVRESISRIDSTVAEQATDSVEAGPLDVGASLLARLSRLP